jgi:glycosyltransferase involved in cell wall biosynthesis
MKKLLYFGIYDRKYARTLVIQHGFERNGWQVDECHVDPKVHRGIGKYFKLFSLGLQARKKNYDLVIVGFPGQSVVWLARLLFGRDIIFDAFLSLYDSNVFDRKLYPENTWRAKKDKWLDTWSCKLAKKVLLETNQHIEYFVETFGIPREKFERIWISADDAMFFPMHVPEDPKFTVHFHGMFIPLQGIKYIVEAAGILRDEDIHFRIVGGGQEYDMIQELVQELKLEGRIEFTGKVPVEKIPGYMASAHIVLGIFGDTEKTKRVIPNKVYEAMAMGKATITADTPAIQELEGSSDALSLVPVSDAKAIAGAILALRSDESKRKHLGHAARALFEKELLPEKMVAKLLRNLDH